MARLPDHKCPGPKPAETEICFAGLCDGPAAASAPPASEDAKDDDYDEDDDEGNKYILNFLCLFTILGVCNKSPNPIGCYSSNRVPAHTSEALKIKQGHGN